MKFELYFAQPMRNHDIIYNNKDTIFYKELLVENICNCNKNFKPKDEEPKEIRYYILNSIEFRINNLKHNEKNNDMISILEIYKKFINKENIIKEDIFLKIGIIRKTEDINKRIKNNYTKLFKLYDDYRYYKNQLMNEKTKKMIKVKEKMHEYFRSEIGLTEKRIEFLSNKLSILKYHNDNIDANDENYLKKYIIDFIDKNVNTDGDIRNVFNDILLYNYGIDGLYYEGIKLPKKCNNKKCQNTKSLCEIKALIYG